MSWHFNISPDVFDFAIRINQESGALDAHIFAAIHAFFLPNIIGLECDLFLIGDERES